MNVSETPDQTNKMQTFGGKICDGALEEYADPLLAWISALNAVSSSHADCSEQTAVLKFNFPNSSANHVYTVSAIHDLAFREASR